MEKMMSGHKHTPTPWVVNAAGNVICSADGKWLADTRTVQREDEEDKENAALIVRAVNSHEQLVAALRLAKHRLDCANKHIDCQDEIDAIVRALAAAGASSAP
jgi:hypothetical protein